MKEVAQPIIRSVERSPHKRRDVCRLRIPTKPAMHSKMKPATYSNPKPAGVPI